MQRLLEHVVPALTVLGLVLYVLMRLPYGIYYGSLGTSPEELGINYVTLLGQSAVGVAAAALLILIGAALVAAIVAYFVGGIFLMSAPRIYSKQIRSLSDPEAVRVIRHRREFVARRFPGLMSATLDPEVVLQMFRLRENKPLTKDHKRELKSLRQSSPVGAFEMQSRMIGDLSSIGTTMLPKALAVTAALVALVGFPGLALLQSDRVRHCSEPTTSSLGILGLRGELAFIHIGREGEKLFPSGQYFLLGSSDVEYVFYECETDRTVRVPRQDDLVVITS